MCSNIFVLLYKNDCFQIFISLEAKRKEISFDLEKLLGKLLLLGCVSFWGYFLSVKNHRATQLTMKIPTTKTILLTCLAFGLSLCNTYAFSHEFEIKTLDKKATISGQIDFPENCFRRSYKAVMIVGGTGLYYRNMYLGLSGTDRDYVAQDMAKDLNKKCLAVVRYDYRGVSCDLIDDATIEACLDQEVRKKVDAEALVEDILAVYNYAKKHSRINSKQIVVNAFSEGSLNIARLIKKKKIQPKGLVFVGGITESASSLVRWQFVDRSVDQAFAMDTNGNGILSNLEVIENYEGSFFEKNDVPMLTLLSPTGAWNRFGLYQSFNLQYGTVVNTVMASPSHLPYRHKDLVYANMGWWQTWFTDREPVIKKLSAYKGPITYFNGTKDIQAPGRRQLEYLKNYTQTMTSLPRFNLIEGKGHLLSDHPEYGPMDLDLKAKVIRAIQASF